MRSSVSWRAQASLNNTQGSCTARGMAREGKGKKTGGVAVGLKWYGTDPGEGTGATRPTPPRYGACRGGSKKTHKQRPLKRPLNQN